MERYRAVLSVFLLCTMLITPAFAHSHPGDPAPVMPKVSPWAQQEVLRAQTLGLLSDLPEDCSAPVTREGFARLVMQYLAAQNRSDRSTFVNLVSFYLAEKPEAVETDGVAQLGNVLDDIACFRALVGEKDAELHDPKGKITRQEAAVMLAEAYAICGGVFADGAAVPFADAEKTDALALKSVANLVSWGVFKGIDGNFAPNDLCSVEQGIVLLLRLFENAPVSRVNGNVTPVFTFEQCMAYLNPPVEKNDKIGYRQSLRIDGKVASFVRLEAEGVMRGGSSFFIVHQSGGIERIDLGICNAQAGANRNLVLENPCFSEDGSQFSCTVTLQADVIAYDGTPEGAILHEKGTYPIAIDVENRG